MLQTAAPPEGITANIPDPFGKRDVCKTGTIFKYGEAEPGDASRDDSTHKVGAIPERTIADVCYRAGNNDCREFFA